MSNELWNQVNTALVAPTPAPENYIKIPGIPSSAAAALPAFAGITAKKYATLEAMTDDGFSPTGFEVLSATNLLTQDTPTGEEVTRWVVIALATFAAQVEEFEVASVVDGTYELFLAPAVGLSPTLAATFIAAANTLTEIKDGLLVSFAIGAYAADFAGATVDADSGSITSNTAGAAFVLTGTGPGGTADITISNATPNAGPAESLDPAFETEDFWDVVPEPGTADALLLEYSRWAEISGLTNSPRRNITHIQTSEAGIIDDLDVTNLALTLQVLKRKRSFGVFHILDSDYMSASVFGLYGGQQAGRRAFHYRPINGTTLIGAGTIGPDVFTFAVGTLLKDRAFGWIAREGNSTTDDAQFLWGQGSAGFFAEQVQAEDAWWLGTKAKMDEIQKSEDGWTMDEPGIRKLISGVDEVNNTLASTNPPVIDINTVVVTSVPLEDIPASERAVGDYQTTGRIVSTATLNPRGRSLRVDGIFPTA